MEAARLLYIVVVEEDDDTKGNDEKSFRYTRHALQSTLQFMGLKARHSFKISQRVFQIVGDEHLKDTMAEVGVTRLGKDPLGVHVLKENGCDIDDWSDKMDGSNRVASEKDGTTGNGFFESYKKHTTTIMKRRRFIDVVGYAVYEYKYVGPDKRADFLLACRIWERKESMTVLLCGTSGCGKSTLSAKLASRMGITSIISTDSIRHAMRSFDDEKQNPLVWSSTYHAGEHLDPVAVSEARAKRKTKIKFDVKSGTRVDLISAKQMVIEGFKAHSEMIVDSLDRLITTWEERKESVIVEGVHLSFNFVMGLMKKHPSIIPFMIYVNDEGKHRERVPVGSLFRTPENKYVNYTRNIRTIQEYLCNQADKHLVPKINNTNADKSVAAIRDTVFGCLRRREAGEQLYDSTTNTAVLVDMEYRNQCVTSPKVLSQLIKTQGVFRDFMVLLNNDGSVAQVLSVNYTNAEDRLRIQMCGPLQMGKAQPFNLMFGNAAVDDWPSDLSCTSRPSTVYDSSSEFPDDASGYNSSCCSSPRVFQGHAKELKEEQSVYGSDAEEVDYTHEIDSDEDLSDDREEMEGSVDEESTKSDEEYDDLAMQDIHENDYFSNVESESENNLSNNPHDAEKYKQNLHRFLRTISEPKLPSSGSLKVRGRSYSISAVGKMNY